MDSSMFSVSVSAVLAILITALTAGSTYYLTRRRELESDWRKIRFELYREFTVSVAGIVDGRSTPDSEIRYHDAFNTLGLVASFNVLRTSQEFQLEISPSNASRTQASHDIKYTNMIKAFRQDLSPGVAQGDDGLNFYLISSRPWSGATTQTSR